MKKSKSGIESILAAFILVYGLVAGIVVAVYAVNELINYL